MNVLYPIGSIYPSQEGGPSNTVYWMASALTQVGINVSIIATSKGLDNSIITGEWRQTAFGRVIYLQSWVHQLPVRLIIESIRKAHTQDIVHLTSIFYPASWMIGLYCVIIRKHIIWSPRGELDDAALIYSRFKKRPVLWLLRLIRNRIWFHATSSEELQYIRKNIGVGEQRIIVVPNYMILPRRRTHQPQERYILFIGRLHPKKGIDRLINAIGSSNSLKGGRIKLMIAGKGAHRYERSLQQMVASLELQDQVEFIGHVEGEVKEQLISNAYVTVVPSHTENFANVVVESLAQETPVIASVGTPWEVLQTIGAGQWVPNTPERLAEAIESILSISPAEYRLMRQKAGRLAAKFDIYENVSKWVAVYSKVRQSKIQDN